MPPGRGASLPGPGAPVARVTGGAGTAVHVALLVPLTGANAERGADLLKAAQLAMATPDAPTMDVKDTGSTADGAAAAARQALAGGAVVIIGPLTSAETAAVAVVARPSRVPVLAFTSDRAQAQPGVWVLGLTPGQQVRRLVQQAQQDGHQRLAALLPQTDTGRAMGQALDDAVRGTGMPPPRVHFYGASMSSLDAGMRDISDYASRRGPMDAQLRAARKSGDPQARKSAQEAARQAVPPAPFDTLLLADTGTALSEIGTLLPYYDVSGTQLMGPASWAGAAARNGTGGVLEGAWYAAPDPAARGGFQSAFTTKYAVQPSVLADLAYDGASIARVTARSAGTDLTASLTRPGGFSGADGTLLLEPDGHVQRALAVFQLQHGTPVMLAPTLPPAT